jgi:uncharacterized protein YciI
MDALADERFLAFGGPAGNQNKVVLIIDAPDETTIHARLARDPWSPAGLLRTLAIEPWTIWLGGDERIYAARAALHLVTWRPGPRWDYVKPRREQPRWDAHAAFMDALTDQGTVVLGGPLDEHRALLVMQDDDESSLRAQLAADPWYDDVLAIDSIEPWALWLPPGPNKPAL